MNCLGCHQSECRRLVVKVVGEGELGFLGVLGLGLLEKYMGIEELRQMLRKVGRLEKKSR